MNLIVCMYSTMQKCYTCSYVPCSKRVLKANVKSSQSDRWCFSISLRILFVPRKNVISKKKYEMLLSRGDHITTLALMCHTLAQCRKPVTCHVSLRSYSDRLHCPWQVMFCTQMVPHTCIQNQQSIVKILHQQVNLQKRIQQNRPNCSLFHVEMQHEHPFINNI